jgi:hypothetical protein
MNYDFRFRLAFLQAGNTTDMIHVRVRARNRLQLKAMFVDRFDDRVRIVARVDADRALGSFTTNDAGVLFESGNGNLFDDHFRQLSVVSCPLPFGCHIQLTTDH